VVDVTGVDREPGARIEDLHDLTLDDAQAPHGTADSQAVQRQNGRELGSIAIDVSPSLRWAGLEQSGSRGRIE
jgi:hypothetical protein